MTILSSRTVPVNSKPMSFFRYYSAKIKEALAENSNIVPIDSCSGREASLPVHEASRTAKDTTLTVWEASRTVTEASLMVWERSQTIREASRTTKDATFAVHEASVTIPQASVAVKLSSGRVFNVYKAFRQ